MNEIINIFFNYYFIFAICYFLTILGKCIVAGIISKNKDMSDKKAKALTKMMSRDININLRH